MHCLIFLLVSPIKIRKHIWVKLAQSLQKTFRRLLHHLVLLSLCHSCSDHLHLHMPTQSKNISFSVKLTKGLCQESSLVLGLSDPKPAVHPFSSVYPIQGHGRAGAHPSCQRTRGRVQPVQVSSVSQG